MDKNRITDMPDMPKVSVLMPIYNAEQYLREAVDSIINQSFTDWELILVNDGSTDKSGDIAQTYNDQRIRYIENSENKGIIYTRNLLIEKSSGEYIAFLDSDDIALVNRLETQVNFLDNHPDYGACGSWGYLIDENEKTTKKINLTVECDEIACTLLFSNTFIQSSILIRKELLVSHPYDKSFHVAEDYELWCRLIKVCKIKNLPLRLIKYRWHAENISKSKKELMLSLTEDIYKRELRYIGIIASPSQLRLHSAIRDKEIHPYPNFSFYAELKLWMKELAAANKKYQLYDHNTFLATIWFRWIFVCKERKAYSKIVSLPIWPNAYAFKKLLGMLYTRL